MHRYDFNVYELSFCIFIYEFIENVHGINWRGIKMNGTLKLIVVAVLPNWNWYFALRA
jgi:hypothetical protein